MDIYEYLKLDHEEVSHLFKQFEDSNLLTRRQQIFSLIATELILHAHSEQDVFYKTLEQYEMTKGEASHGKKEHKEIENQIKLITNTPVTHSSWSKNIEELKDIVEHHVHEEESTIFRKAKKVLSETDALILKEKMHYLKMQLKLNKYSNK